MGRELDEAWIDEAIARYRRAEQLRAELAARLPVTEVCVRSPDQLVEVVVSADGAVRGVRVTGSPPDLAGAIATAVAAAPDAAAWARRRLYAVLAESAAADQQQQPSDRDQQQAGSGQDSEHQPNG
jgi:hypothetical protein